MSERDRVRERDREREREKERERGGGKEGVGREGVAEIHDLEIKLEG